MGAAVWLTSCLARCQQSLRIVPGAQSVPRGPLIDGQNIDAFFFRHCPQTLIEPSHERGPRSRQPMLIVSENEEDVQW